MQLLLLKVLKDETGKLISRIRYDVGLPALPDHAVMCHTTQQRAAGMSSTSLPWQGKEQS